MTFFNPYSKSVTAVPKDQTPLPKSEVQTKNPLDFIFPKRIDTRGDAVDKSLKPKSGSSLIPLGKQGTVNQGGDPE